MFAMDHSGMVRVVKQTLILKRNLLKMDVSIDNQNHPFTTYNMLNIPQEFLLYVHHH